MLETKFIAELNPEYNILRLVGNRISHKLSPDTRARISAAKSTVEARALVSAARKGVHPSRALISQMSTSTKIVHVYNSDFILLNTYR